MAKIIKNIDLAVEELLAGEAVALPTETVYGLAANALDAGSVLKIFKIKKRPHLTYSVILINTIPFR
jgi:L-threonylcarbamoyladenylate synthase